MQGKGQCACSLTTDMPLELVGNSKAR